MAETRRHKILRETSAEPTQLQAIKSLNGEENDFIPWRLVSTVSLILSFLAMREYEKSANDLKSRGPTARESKSPLPYRGQRAMEEIFLSLRTV